MTKSQMPGALKRLMPEIEWGVHLPFIAEIKELKLERRAVILAHNYMPPEIVFSGIADFVGDSLQLAREAAKMEDVAVIVQAGVHFMAETSKILCPQKTLLIPDLRAGCSLAASITGADVRALRQKHPGVPIVTYVNTSAEVKAESDVCCTSSNAVDVVRDIAREFGTREVLMIPDEYLALAIAKQAPDLTIHTWKGHCEVHERFTGEQIRELHTAYPDIIVLAHPECPPDVLAEADFQGSTSAMNKYIRTHRPNRVAMITECSMGTDLAYEFPEIQFIQPCNLCPHMHRITLENIRDALAKLQYEVLVDPAISIRAKRAIDRMLQVGAPK